VYGGRAFRTQLDARWAVFLDALPFPWRYETELLVLEGGVHYRPDFYLPSWDVYLEVRPDFPGEWVTQDEVTVVADRDGLTPLGTFLIASERLARWEERVCRPRLFMLCGSPGVPRLRDWRGRWKLDGGCAVLHLALVDGRLLLPVEAWSDTEEGGLDFWPYYLDGAAGGGECRRESAFYPSGKMTNLYMGDGRGYATPRLARAYRAARDARFDGGEDPAARR
jgi:hypothetical protein